jgi:hypothetical protein
VGAATPVKNGGADGEEPLQAVTIAVSAIPAAKAREIEPGRACTKASVTKARRWSFVRRLLG